MRQVPCGTVEGDGPGALTGPVFGLGFGFLPFGTVPTAASLTGTIVVLPALALLSRSGRSPRR